MPDYLSQYRRNRSPRIVSAAAGAVADAYVPPAYTNADGTGDRRTTVLSLSNCTYTGALSALLNGSLNTNDFYWGGQNTAGKYILFSFGYKALITEAKYHQQTNSSQGVWQWQGSNDAINWTDIGATFTLGNVTPPQTITELSANLVGYVRYRLYGISGTLNNGPYVYEFEFKIGALI
jgi:hypothetical protein